MSKQKDRITIADVAARASVSSMTVSRVINNKAEISDETRQHVLRVMAEMGYRPNRIARSLATDRTLKVGIIVPALSSYYFGAVLDGIEHIMWENGYHILLCNTGDSLKREKAVMEFFEEDRVDGVIVMSSQLAPDVLGKHLNNQRAAIVVNTIVDSPQCSSIMVNEHAAMQIMVDHMVTHGRTNLAYIGIPRRSYASRERWDGFKLAMQRHNLTTRDDWMIETNDTGWDTAFTVTQRLLTDHAGIDGIVCFNDNIAAGVIRACNEMKIKVPEMVAVIGYDDVFLAEVITPSLTTLRLSISKRGLGELAAQMLLDRMEGTVKETCVYLDHELVIRDSAP